jgi:hypothetical protein
MYHQFLPKKLAKMMPFGGSSPWMKAFIASKVQDS